MDTLYVYRLRTEIRHKYAYHFQASKGSRKHHSGLDFTKAVIVANQEFINEDITVVDQDEYKEVIRDFAFKKKSPILPIIYETKRGIKIRNKNYSFFMYKQSKRTPFRV